ncbi:MAG: helix-turn-helix domain-containing protein [Eubacterium sp.]|nr:helix-turn-helix domain-containing protein [Eubacterium sp.]
MDERYSKKAVGARLKEFRLSLHQTQKEFAEQMNWDVNTYRKIETGFSLLTSDKAQMLYDKFEIDITYILTGDKLNPDDHLKQLWLTADRTERKQLIARLISYVEEML